MTIDIDELEKLARAATPGPWTARDLSGDGHWQVDEPLESPSSHGDFLDESNASFIAAANPAVILDLCTELRRLRRYERAVRWVMDHVDLDDDAAVVVSAAISRAIKRRMEEP